jgi:nondiscriminating glutamyl-tRNA synthetase
MGNEFRTRQAPSPTGYLHIGTTRQLLFTKLFAKINNGVWYLRIEDTDRQRLIPEAVPNMLETLSKLSLNPQEGVTLEEANHYNDFYKVYQKGDYGPYFQSQRLDLYYKHAQNLIDRKLAYWSFLTEEEKNELQEIKKISQAPINYFKSSLEKYGQESLFISVEEGLKDPKKPSLRYRIQREQKISCQDELLGKSEFDLALEEDFTILKSDGYPTYHLAHLIDDNLMETSLVIRAQEWYPSLAKHTTMFLDYWGKSPKYIHLPVILGKEGNKKLSKRDNDVNMIDYLDKGYLPEAVLNYLVFLAWNPGTEKEIYLEEEVFQNLDSSQRTERLIDNLAAEFKLESLSKSPSRFNPEKLNWFNKEYLKMFKPTPFLKLVRRYLQDLTEVLKKAEPYQEARLEKIRAILSAIDSKLDVNSQNFSSPLTKIAFLFDQTRISTLSELGSDSSCLINHQKPSKELLKWKKISLEESLNCLKELTEVLENDIFASDLGKKLAQKQSELYKYAESEEGDYLLQEKLTELSGTWEKIIKDWLVLNQKDAGSYLWPLRVALSGKAKSPGPFELISVLPMQIVIDRINKSLFD